MTAPLPDGWRFLVMRQGRKVGRTLYLNPVDDPDGDGHLVGLVDSPELAANLVARWNATLRRPAP